MDLESKEIKNKIEYFLGVEDDTDKYQLFNEWCAKEGVHMPKLEYPAYFEGGLLGTKVTEDI